MTITIFSTFLFVIVSVGLIFFGMDIEKGLISITGAVLLAVFFIGSILLYGDFDKITVLEADTLLNKYEISDDLTALEKASKLNETISNGKIFPIVNEDGKIEYKLIEYGDNVKIKESIKDGYIEEYTTRKITTINPQISKIKKFLVQLVSFKKVENIKFDTCTDDIYYKIYLN